MAIRVMASLQIKDIKLAKFLMSNVIVRPAKPQVVRIFGQGIEAWWPCIADSEIDFNVRKKKTT